MSRIERFNNKRYRIPLNLDQKQLVKKFIITFLPKTRTKRKYPGNTIDYARFVLDRVLMNKLGFGN